MIETERLYLRPMKIEELELYSQDYKLFCEKFSIKQKHKEIEPFMDKVFRIKINNIQSDRENWLYYTYFLIIYKATNTECGLIGFKGNKDLKGFTEVGYGIDNAYRKMGLMTEALCGFCAYFIENKYLTGIKAEVKKDNLASIKTLEKSGFSRESETEDFYQYLRI